MIGDNGKGVIALARSMNYPTRMFISLTGSCLEFGTAPDINCDIICTNGLYHLVYNTRTRNNEINAKKFCLVYDFGRKFTKFETWKELEAQAQTNDYVRFFLKYTNLHPHMLTIARQNEGMHIPVSFDIIKYDNEIRTREGWAPKEWHMMYNPFRDSQTAWYGVDESGKIYKYDIDKKGADTE